MIKQTFDVDGYWKVVVYYDVDYGFLDELVGEMVMLGGKGETIGKVLGMMQSGKVKAVTYSNTEDCVSLILFNQHQDKADYINSIVHEAEHVKQAMLEAYAVKDEGEAPAYTIGYLVGRMWEVAKDVIDKG